MTIIFSMMGQSTSLVNFTAFRPIAVQGNVTKRNNIRMGLARYYYDRAVKFQCGDEPGPAPAPSKTSSKPRDLWPSF